MLLQALAFLAGLGLLYAGAEALVAGATRLARALGLSSLLIGLTVVAFGTSAPELVVSTLAAAEGTPDLAIGNVIGSNIANIALILALSALVWPLRVESRLVAREIPLMIAASIGFLLLLIDGAVGRGDALILLTAFVGYLWFAFRTRTSLPREITAPSAGSDPATSESEGWTSSRLAAVGLVVVGLGGLVVGAQLLVNASVWFAREVGVSELVIGLTLVAVGTSLPELATSVVASARRNTDIAVGNVVGSNVFNLLAILGCAALVRPLPAAPELLRFQGPVMVVVAILLLPLARTGFRVQRWEGALLLAAYGGFLWMLVATRG